MSDLPDPNFIVRHKDELSVILDTLIAIGTIGAVVVGIFGVYIRSLFIRPKLTLEVDLKKNTVSDKETDIPSPGDSQSRNVRNYHIRVNNTGKATAKNCQASIDEVYEQREDGNSWELKKRLFSVPLLWLNNNDSFHIRKRMSSYIRLLHVQEEINSKDSADGSNSNLTQSTPTSMSMSFCFSQKNISLSLIPGTYIFELKVYADDVSPVTKYIEVFWKKGCSWQHLDNIHYFNIRAITEKEFKNRKGNEQ